MRVTGIICEYNPFHNGHALHIKSARAQSGADYVVCVMSGSFVQRGEGAMYSKWLRAKSALDAGADAVFELPTLWALSEAERFARGSISLLRGLGVVTHLSFGCEEEALPHLDNLSQALGGESPAFKAALKAQLAQGKSYPRARSHALSEMLDSPALDSLLDNPNLTLALEYMRAIKELAPKMTPVPIARKGAGYHDETPGVLSSATGVRSAILHGDWNAVARAVPDVNQLRGDESPLLPDALDLPLLYRLRTTTPEEMRALRDMPEGIEYRILEGAQHALSRQSLIEHVKTKRYTYARISRILASVLLHIPASLADHYPLVPYARLLGFRRAATPLLRIISDCATLPIINRPGMHLHLNAPVFALDVRATDVRALALGLPSGSDMTQPPIII